MENRYKLILSSRRLYREVEVSGEQQRITIGTSIESDVRFRKDDFFESFSLSLINDEEKWTLECSENIYIMDGSVQKLIIRPIAVDEKLYIKYRSSDAEVFTLYFLYDFEYLQKSYDRVINLSGHSLITIGGNSGCNIKLNYEKAKKDCLELVKDHNTYELRIRSTGIGVKVNGISVYSDVLLKPLDFISVGPYSFCYSDGKLFTDRKNDLLYSGVSVNDENHTYSKHEYPRFNRSSRIKDKVSTESISILDPPNEPHKPEKNIVKQLFPAIAMLAATILIRGVLNTSGATFILMSCCSICIGVVSSVMGIITERKQYREDVENRLKAYDEYIQNKRKFIEETRLEEKRLLEKMQVSVNEQIRKVNTFSPQLFERNPSDEDYLEIRLGTGSKESVRKIDYKSKETIEVTDKLMMIPEQMAEEFKVLQNVPITLRLCDTNMVGVVGSREQLYEMLKVLTVHITTEHYFTEVQLMYCMDESDSEKLEWIRMIPHVQNEILNRRNIICDEESKAILLDYLYKLLSVRSHETRGQNIIIFVYKDNGIQNHPVTKLLREKGNVGITFIYFQEYEENLPQECDYILRMEGQYRGKKICCQDGTNAEVFNMETVSDDVMRYTARRLAPIYCDEISLESALTKNISFFELYGIYEPADIDIGKNWANAKVNETLAAPLGVKSKNQIISLDIHEKNHGPHGLVAGTTGSGKSEILQSYILSMAMLYHPYEVGFVIIDFKGGGMVNQFENLPHLIGAITDIDGREIDRSLLSIRAEINKRKELFAKYKNYKINHIDGYIDLYKKGIAEIPMPHLILIVDEFAELKKEQPDFMSELISTARVGRSLGIHLILATQKPSGVVDPQIWSNSKFKLCLKVQSKSDSNEVLKSPLAAEIKEPGRAYLQVGNNEVFELFQSAYSGGAASAEGSMSKKKIQISRVSFEGKRTLIYERKAEKKEQQEGNTEKEITQLTSIVDYVEKYCMDHAIERLPYIFLPPLKKRIEFKSTVDISDVEEGYVAHLGIYDAPAEQYQGDWRINVTTANTIIIGSAQNGKTNLIQTMIRSLAEQYTPKQINMYILDFGSTILSKFEDLNHVGGVVLPNEDEKLKNLFKLLRAEVEQRKELLSEKGVSSFASYLEAGFQEIPQIVVFIDNFTAMRELYLSENDFLLSFCRDGLAVGISFVFTNAQTNGLSYNYLANFEQRVALYCNDNSVYSMLLEYSRMQPLNTPGRCLITKNKTIYEAQTYLAFEGKKEIDRANNISEFIAEQNKKYAGMYSKIIPVVPKILTEDIILKKFGCEVSKTETIVGLDYESISPIKLDWMSQGVFAISGKETLGLNDYVKYLIGVARRNGTQLYILDDFNGRLGYAENLDQTQFYSKSIADLPDLLAELEMNLSARYEMLMEWKEEEFERQPLIWWLIQNPDTIAALHTDHKLMAIYKDILNKYSGMKCGIIYTNLPNAAAPYPPQEPLKMLNDHKQYLIFENMEDIKLFATTTNLKKKYHKPLERGEAYLVQENQLKKMKLISTES